MIEDVFILFMTILAERAVIGMINNFWIIAKHRTEIFFTHICMMILLMTFAEKKMFSSCYESQTEIENSFSGFTVIVG